MRVLIAEDDIVGSKILKAQLTRWKHQVDVVGRGDEALDLLEKPHDYDLAILDWELPGLDGPDICRAVRQEEQDHYLYVILLTSRSGRSDVVEAFDAGVDDFLTKPYDPDELQARLSVGQRVVERKNSLRERIALVERTSKWLYDELNKTRSEDKVATRAVLVPLHSNSPIASLANQLSRHLEQDQRGIPISRQTVSKELGEDYTDMDIGDSGSGRLLTWLEEQEESHDVIFYEACFNHPEWTRLLLHRADIVLWVTHQDDSPEASEFEQDVLGHTSFSDSVRQELVILHPEIPKEIKNIRAWAKPRPTTLTHHLALNHDPSLARLVRLISGRGVGLCLSGGSSSGIAHVGVIQALKEKGIEPDIIVGTSIGAGVGALSALSETPAQIIDRMIEFATFNWLRKLRFFKTLGPPILSLFSGGSLERDFRKFFGDVRIEELHIPLIMVTTSLTRGVTVPLYKGPVWLGFRASSSLPGILPPVNIDGELLVDGGVTNNLPADLLRPYCQDGTIIASDVSDRSGFAFWYDYGHAVSGWWMLGNKFSSLFKRGPYNVDIPNLAQVIDRCVTLHSFDDTQHTTRDIIDIYIAPDVPHEKVLWFNAKEGAERIRNIVECGYSDALKALKKQDPDLQ
ncbi:MAG: response regulator [Deltaproteobacteria bacterium]|jgi:predicted acylesterase/phospholipase RssA/DNA-binding response OmpR family regulator|nr:response regulator [Deltaproteobacteria bacterium]